jgi:hypothetical protein
VPKDRITAEQRRLVVDRSKGCCEYCYSQVNFATQSFSVEHILPRHKGGKNSLENLAWACQGCNGHKHVKVQGTDPITTQVVPLFHPRQQLWQDHFTWNADYTMVIGLTPVGRATVRELHLNREGVMNLRRALFALGEHPPKSMSS